MGKSIARLQILLVTVGAGAGNRLDKARLKYLFTYFYRDGSIFGIMIDI